MVETTLTPEMIGEGAIVIQKLDEMGISPDAAFWFYFPDIGAYKLILAQVKVGADGPKGVYRSIQKALQGLGTLASHISLDDVAVAKPDAPVVKLLAQVIGTGAGISGIRFSKNVIDGIPIDDAYIYRLTKAAA